MNMLTTVGGGGGGGKKVNEKNPKSMKYGNRAMCKH